MASLLLNPSFVSIQSWFDVSVSDVVVYSCILSTRWVIYFMASYVELNDLIILFECRNYKVKPSICEKVLSFTWEPIEPYRDVKLNDGGYWNKVCAGRPRMKNKTVGCNAIWLFVEAAGSCDAPCKKGCLAWEWQLSVANFNSYSVFSDASDKYLILYLSLLHCKAYFSDVCSVFSSCSLKKRLKPFN